MKTLSFGAIALILSMAAASPAPAGPNEDLAGKVAVRLLTSDQIDGTTIFTRADGGKVYLVGAVESEEAKRKAEEIARSVTGVTEVENAIGVVEASAEQYAVHADLNTPEAAQHEAPAQGSLAPPPAGAGVGDGASASAGVGARQAEAKSPSHCVGARYRSRLLGVPAAQTMPELSDDELRTRVAAALENDPLLEGSSIRVTSVSDGTVRLEGRAQTVSVHKNALETALHVGGVCKVASDVTSGADASAGAAAGEADAEGETETSAGGGTGDEHPVD